MKEMIYQKRPKEPIVIEDNYLYGFRYIILNLGSHPCCYVEIPKKNKFFGLTTTNKEVDILRCHGGITFASNELGTRKNSWFLGWDFAHLGDFVYSEYPWMAPFNTDDEKKWSYEELLNEIVNVINQLKEPYIKTELYL